MALQASLKLRKIVHVVSVIVWPHDRLDSSEIDFPFNVVTCLFWLCRLLWPRAAAPGLKACKRGLPVHYGGYLSPKLTA